MTRTLPELTPENTPFWTGGARGELMIAHCNACDHSIHPPQVVCPRCLSDDVAPRAAQGSGTIYARTINRHAWSPEIAVPYVIAVIDLDGEPGVRITARMVDCEPEAVAIGDRVKVRFEEDRGIWVPVFAPFESGRA